MTALEVPASTLWRFPCDGPCEPANDRPYSREKGRPSMTTLGGVINKGDGLIWGAAGEVSTYWQNHARELLVMDSREAWDKGRRVWRGVWDKAALMGTLSHDAAQAWAHGATWALPTEWKGKPLELSDEEVAQVYRYVEGLSHWWAKRGPLVLASELIVCRDNPNTIGSIDQLAQVALPIGKAGEDGVRELVEVVAIVDFKHTKKIDGDPYLDDWERQLQGYATCDRVRHYHKGTLVSEIAWPDDLPRPTHGLLVNVQGDGSVREYVCELDAGYLRQVEHLAEVKAWKPTMKQTADMNRPELVVYAPTAAANAGVSTEAML